MAAELTPPTVAELVAFMHVESVDDDSWAEQVLQDATDILMVSTGVRIYPTDPPLSRVVRNGIMDLAQWLITKRDNAEEEYSPFNSEHIGSYSYAKQYAQTKSESGGIATTFWYNQALALLQANKNTAWVCSENVMPTSPEPPIFVDLQLIPDFFGR